MTGLSLARRSLLAMLAASPAAAAVGTARQAGEPTGPWTGGGDIACGGGRLHYATLGPAAGEPLVLLHKLGGWIADWRGAAPYLAQHRQVIAFDLPGHGDSVMYGPPPPIMTVPEITAMILAALDDLGVDRFSVAGNSLGGIVGVLLAALWPDRVSKLVLASVSLIGRMTRAQIAEQDAERAKRGSGGAFIAPQSSIFETMVPEVTREHALGSARAGAWLRPCERGVGVVGVTDYLPRIKAPTLLINADRGHYVKYGDVGERLIPHARQVTIANAGSFVHQEKPRETAVAINAFLAD